MNKFETEAHKIARVFNIKDEQTIRVLVVAYGQGYMDGFNGPLQKIHNALDSTPRIEDLEVQDD